MVNLLLMGFKGTEGYPASLRTSRDIKSPVLFFHFDTHFGINRFFWPEIEESPALEGECILFGAGGGGGGGNFLILMVLGAKGSTGASLITKDEEEFSIGSRSADFEELESLYERE
jgi:hypothetical protein